MMTDTGIPLQYRDEIVRHKILDVVGDMGLLGFLHVPILSQCGLGMNLIRGLMQEILRQRVSEDGSADR